MAAYNAEAFIEDAIKSVLDQTYDQFELIVVDDCSADHTKDIIQRYAKRDKRLRLICNATNQGVAKSRNKGVSVAEGTWIAFLDSDDLWKPEKLEKQIQLLKKKKDAALVFTGSAFIDGVGNASNFILNVPKDIDFHQLLKQNVISCSSVLVQKDLLARFQMPEGSMIHEDFATWLQILQDGNRAYGINEPLLIYRMTASSKSGNKKKAFMMTYHVYQYIGLNRIAILYYLIQYSIRNIRKYRKIRNGFSIH